MKFQLQYRRTKVGEMVIHFIFNPVTLIPMISDAEHRNLSAGRVRREIKRL